MWTSRTQNQYVYKASPRAAALLIFSGWSGIWGNCDSAIPRWRRLQIMAVISCARTLQFLQPQNLSFPQSSRFPSQFPRVCHVKTAVSLKSRKTSDITPSLLARASSSTDYTATIGEILGEVRIFTASGEPVLFKDLWDQEEVSFTRMLYFRYYYHQLFSLVIIEICDS